MRRDVHPRRRGQRRAAGRPGRGLDLRRQAGNDVLTGGYDRRPRTCCSAARATTPSSCCPTTCRSSRARTETYIPTLTDRFDGGTGQRPRAVPGRRLRPPRPAGARRRRDPLEPLPAPLRVHRAAVGHGEPAASPSTSEVVSASRRAARSPASPATVEFRLRVPDPAQPGPRSSSPCQPDVDANRTSRDLAEDIQARAQRRVRLRRGRHSRVIVEFPDGICACAPGQRSSSSRADATDPIAHRARHFDAARQRARRSTSRTSPSTRRVSVEKTVIDTRAGDDVVHGNPEFMYPERAERVGHRPGRLRSSAALLGSAGDLRRRRQRPPVRRRPRRHHRRRRRRRPDHRRRRRRPDRRRPGRAT